MRSFWLALALLPIVACHSSGMQATQFQLAGDLKIAEASPLDAAEVKGSESLPSTSPENAKPTKAPDKPADKVQPPTSKKADSYPDLITAPAVADDSRRDLNFTPLPTPENEKRSFVLQGYLKPTVYYQPLLIDNDKVCDPRTRVTMYSPKGVALMKVCRKTMNVCMLEGSCRISQNGVIRSFNVQGGSKAASTFFEVHENDCFYGFGVNKICLDPFYSVAADLKYYHPGDVIYVPALNGVPLPNGELHTGFLIVRDRGGGIKGPDRFDFFSGSLNWTDPLNPFGKIRLSDQKTRFVYYKVRGDLVQQVRNRRGYPQIPELR